MIETTRETKVIFDTLKVLETQLIELSQGNQMNSEEFKERIENIK